MSRRTRALTLVALAAVIGVAGWAVGPDRLRDRAEGWWKAFRESVLADDGAAQTVTWCPMDPQIVRNGPGMCPICNMELVPKEGGEAREPGVLVLSTRQVQQAGVRLGTARVRDLVREIDATGRLELDPGRRFDVAMPFPGTSTVAGIHVRSAGEAVRENQVVLEVLNPMLLELLGEYREVLASIGEHRRNGREAEATAALGRMRELRTQAADWGLDGRNLDFFASQPKFQFSDPELPVFCRQAGVVLEAPDLYEGMRIEAGRVLLRLADLEELWLYVDLYEHELVFVRKDQTIEFTTFSVPDEAFRTRIRSIEPVVQPGTQTVRALARVNNKDGRLKPGAFVRSRIACPVPGALSVPESSVLQSGRRNVVIVSEGDGRFRPRIVEMGRQHLFAARPDDAETAFGPDDERFHEILGGLVEGDRVVVAGNFLLNAEAQFQGILEKMIEADDAERSAPSLTASETSAMAEVEDAYLAIATALVNDDASRLRMLGRRLAEAAAKAGEGAVAHGTFVELEREGRALAGLAPGDALDWDALDWDALRSRFGALSRQLVGFVREYTPGRVTGGELFLFRCPMADDFGYELWLQKDAALANPYMGQSMPECGMPAELD